MIFSGVVAIAARFFLFLFSKLFLSQDPGSTITSLFPVPMKKKCKVHQQGNVRKTQFKKITCVCIGHRRTIMIVVLHGVLCD
jgi:hypothetical protein